MNREFNEEIDFYINNYLENSNVLKRIKSAVNEIDEKLSSQYSLVFIAEKGAGKTTVIDYFMDLIYEKEKINDKTGKKYKVIEDILETGSGATTTSEVELCQSLVKNTKIKIIPYSEEDIIDLLVSFSKIMFNNAHDIKDAEQLSMASELIRACRNMTGLTENKKLREDYAKNLAMTYEVNQYNDYKIEVIKCANLENRKRLEFVYERGTVSEKEWLKKVFRKINLVHIEDSPLPKKIIIELNKEIFDFSKLKRINKIIDTRGLEVGPATDRSDIKGLFRDEQNSILLFVDKFNSPSKSIIDLFDQYIYDKDMECIDRLGYIVNFRDGEPENVIDCSGIVESELDGISEKMNQVIEVFKENDINFRTSNIIYINPKRFLNQEGKIKFDEDECDIYEFDTREEIIEYKKRIRELERREFEENIINIIEEYDLRLFREKEEILNRYSQIKNDIDKISLVNIEKVSNMIKDESLSFRLKELIMNMYSQYINEKFPSTLMAMNKRYGIYNNNDIYCEGANFIERCVKGDLKYFKDSIIYVLNELKEQKSINSNQKNSIDFLVRDINNYFFKYIEVINNYFYDKLKNKIYSAEDEKFWNEVKNRWGKGSGYRQDINNYYKENIVAKSFNDEIDEEVKNLVNAFKLGLIDILDKINQ